MKKGAFLSSAWLLPVLTFFVFCLLMPTAVSATEEDLQPWLQSDSFTVSDAVTLVEALNYYKYSYKYAYITLTEDAVINKLPSSLYIDKNVTLTVNPGATLTLSGECLDVKGTLNTNEDGINFDNGSGWLWLDYGGYWNRGDVKYNCTAGERYHIAEDNATAEGTAQYSSRFRFDNNGNGLTVSGGWYSDLYVSGSEKRSFADGLYYEGAHVYLNNRLIIANDSNYQMLYCPDMAGLAWHTAYNSGSGIVIMSDMTLTASDLCSYKGLGTYLAPGVTVTITPSYYVGGIMGTLTCDEGAVAAEPDALFMLCDGGSLHYGDVIYEAKITPGFEEELDDNSTGFIFDISGKKWQIRRQNHLDLYITLPKGKSVSDLPVSFDTHTIDLVYVNGRAWSPSKKAYISNTKNAAATAAVTATDWKNYTQSDFYYMNLNEGERKLYDRITEYLDSLLFSNKNYSKKTNSDGLVEYSFDMSEFSDLDTERIAKVVSQYDLSKYFFADNITYCTDCGAVELTLYPEYAKGRTRMKAVKKLDKKIASLVKKINKNCSTDFEKLKYIHNTVCSLTAYDHALADGAARADRKGNSITNVLNGRSAICSGYARTFNLLANIVGVESIYVTGCEHAWNKVKLNGIWYNVDCTWDDADPETTDSQTLRYFLFSDNERPDYYAGYYYNDESVKLDSMPAALSNYR